MQPCFHASEHANAPPFLTAVHESLLPLQPLLLLQPSRQTRLSPRDATAPSSLGQSNKQTQTQATAEPTFKHPLRCTSYTTLPYTSKRHNATSTPALSTSRTKANKQPLNTLPQQPQLTDHLHNSVFCVSCRHRRENASTQHSCWRTGASCCSL